jgi:hypothetical protein
MSYLQGLDFFCFEIDPLLREQRVSGRGSRIPPGFLELPLILPQQLPSQFPLPLTGNMPAFEIQTGCLGSTGAPVCIQKYPSVGMSDRQQA